MVCLSTNGSAASAWRMPGTTSFRRNPPQVTRRERAARCGRLDGAGCRLRKRAFQIGLPQLDGQVVGLVPGADGVGAVLVDQDLAHRGIPEDGALVWPHVIRVAMETAGDPGEGAAMGDRGDDIVRAEVLADDVVVGGMAAGDELVPALAALPAIVQGALGAAEPRGNLGVRLGPGVPGHPGGGAGVDLGKARLEYGVEANVATDDLGGLAGASE